MNHYKSELGCEYLPGTLVEVKTSSGLESGIVVDWWPSNVYESAYYDIHIDGKTLPFERKHVYGPVSTSTRRR